MNESLQRNKAPNTKNRTRRLDPFLLFTYSLIAITLIAQLLIILSLDLL